MRKPYGEFMGLGVMDNRIYMFGQDFGLGYSVAPLPMEPPYVPPVYGK
jgi:hypothetical protein